MVHLCELSLKLVLEDDSRDIEELCVWEGPGICSYRDNSKYTQETPNLFDSISCLTLF